jgi:glyoxylase-like metal-dependent hydrolase (beta-lactamase superfamily II)
MYKLGSMELHAVQDGTFSLDGGAMFGIVPKPVWERVMKPDARNRIPLSITCLLVRSGGKTVLVDAGLGDKRDAKFRELYAVDRSRTTLLQGLAAAGVTPEDVDVVILSHLHFDHCGGATRLVGGEWVPTFPRAVHVIQEGMWEEALDPNPRTKGSYFHEDFLPLQKAGLVKFVKGTEEVLPGIRAELSGGHVKCHQIATFESQGRRAIFWADLLPTTAHVKPAWTMGYDLFPHEVATLRSKILEESAAKEWINVFEHDPSVAMGFVRKDEKGYRVEAVERLPGAV